MKKMMFLQNIIVIQQDNMKDSNKKLFKKAKG